jgi:hypothetical protein
MSKKKKPGGKKPGGKKPVAIIDPEQIFRHALAFEYAEIVLKADESAAVRAFKKTGATQIWLPPTIVPQVVIAAFALELYLKCLIYLETGSAPQGHEIVKLFRKVSAAKQAKIRTIYQANVGNDVICRHIIAQFKNPHLFDFDPVLNSINTTFVDWRYYYEKPVFTGTEARFFLAPVRTVIFELRPTWQTIWDNFRVQPTSPIR